MTKEKPGNGIGICISGNSIKAEIERETERERETESERETERERGESGKMRKMVNSLSFSFSFFGIFIGPNIRCSKYPGCIP